MLFPLEMFIALQVQINISRDISLAMPLIRLAKDHVQMYLLRRTVYSFISTKYQIL